MVTVKEFALTTKDNPFDPFTDFKKWFVFDVEHHYDSCSLLGRIAKTSDEMTVEENYKEVENAIDKIIKMDFENVYRKVSRNVEIA